MSPWKEWVLMSPWKEWVLMSPSPPSRGRGQGEGAALRVFPQFQAADLAAMDFVRPVGEA